MAPTTSDASLLARQTNNVCRNGYYSYGRCYSAWDYYGRWIFAAIVLALVVIVFFVWACVNSRRRRKRGNQPMYGTGWMAPAGNMNNRNAYSNPPPAYGQPPDHNQSYPMGQQYTGNTFQTTDGYYGQHEGINGPKTGGNDYAPPPGPPPVHTRP